MEYDLILYVRRVDKPLCENCWHIYAKLQRGPEEYIGCIWICSGDSGYSVFSTMPRGYGPLPDQENRWTAAVSLMLHFFAHRRLPPIVTVCWDWGVTQDKDLGDTYNTALQPIKTGQLLCYVTGRDGRILGVAPLTATPFPGASSQPHGAIRGPGGMDIPGTPAGPPDEASPADDEATG